MTLRGYWQAARQARYALLFALPLLLLYEGLSFALTQSAYAGVRNGADVLLKTLFVAFGGRHGLAVFSLLLVGWAARSCGGTRGATPAGWSGATSA